MGSNVQDSLLSEYMQKRKYILERINKKDLITKQIDTNFEILKLNNVNMNTELVDKDDFPISEYDIHAIRNARTNIKCLNNDLRNIMEDIEKNMEELNSMRTSLPEDLLRSIFQDHKPSAPILSVVKVHPGSPGFEAGIQEGDLITHFGGIEASSFTNLSDLANLLKERKDTLVKIVLIRNEERKCAYLKPRDWNGPVLSGCLFNLCKIKFM